MFYHANCKVSHIHEAFIRLLGLTTNGVQHGDTFVIAAPADQEGYFEAILSALADGFNAVGMMLPTGDLSCFEPVDIVVARSHGMASMVAYGYTIWAPSGGGSVRLVRRDGKGAALVFEKNGLKEVGDFSPGLEVSATPGFRRAMEHLLAIATELALQDGIKPVPLAA